MYLPSSFEESRPDVLHDFVRAHPLALLVTAGGELEANLLPLHLHRNEVGTESLIGHVARANPVWKLAANSEVLVVFQGPQAYVSPSWYASKREDGKVVPTWNYAVVQAWGRLRVHEDAGWIRRLLDKLTAQMEAPRNEPWQIDDAPADYIDRLLGHVVGIEIEVARWQGKWKMSQNQGAANRAGVAAGLRAEGAEDVAALVSERAQTS